MRYFYFIIFIAPFFISLVPFISNDYGKGQYSCWFDEQKVDKLRPFLWQMCYFYIPLWISITFNLLNYIRIYLFVKKEDFDNEFHINITKRLRYYPLIMIVCYSLDTVNFIWKFTFEENLGTNLMFLGTFLTGL